MICNVCGGKRFLSNLVCQNCGSNSCYRAAMYVLCLHLKIKDFPMTVWPKSSLKLIESAGVSFYPVILKEKFKYINTEYQPGSKKMRESYTNRADFQELAYPDNELDGVISINTFEHIRDDQRAFREVYRVLKPTGFMVLTIPYRHDWEETEIRCKVDGDKDIHLLPPEYHGGHGALLSYRTYGRDIMENLREIGFSVGFLGSSVPEYNICGEFVFLCVKGPIDLGSFTRTIFLDRPHVPIPLFWLFHTVKYNLKSVRHFWDEVKRKILFGRDQGNG